MRKGEISNERSRNPKTVIDSLGRCDNAIIGLIDGDELKCLIKGDSHALASIIENLMENEGFKHLMITALINSMTECTEKPTLN